MRYTEYYNQPAPELGETADITVVTNAILAGEKNQSGRVESIKATYSGNLITLKSETRQSNLIKYYNGLSFTFLSPLRLEKNDAKYQIKVDNLTAQPFKVKTAVNIGELVTVIFDSTNGFISANSPIPRSSATDSDSEETVATSRALKNVSDKLNTLDTNFRNYCPYAVGDIYITTNSANPSSVYLGTTWEKIENRFLLGSQGSKVPKDIGGSMTKTITQNNLPNTKLKIDTFTLSHGTFKIVGQINNIQTDSRTLQGYSGALYYSSSWANGYAEGKEKVLNINFDSSRAGATSGSFGQASPQTSALGNGQPFDITPAYYIVNIWLRLT